LRELAGESKEGEEQKDGAEGEPVGRVVVAVANFTIYLPTVLNNETGVSLAKLISGSTNVSAQVFVPQCLNPEVAGDMTIGARPLVDLILLVVH